VIASFDGAGDIVYLETAASGQVTETPSVIAEITLTYDTLRSEALPRTASRELIMKVLIKMDLTDAEWRKSRYSGSNGGNCVEVAGNLPGVVAVRDSKARRA